jgi:hypothetical protein
MEQPVYIIFNISIKVVEIANTKFFMLSTFLMDLEHEIYLENNFRVDALL